MAGDDLIGWLRTQLDETERDARDIHDEPADRYMDGDCVCDHPDQVRRQVAAHRAIVAQCEAMEAGAEAAAGTLLGGAARVRLGAYQFAVKHLASIYSDRSGYRQEWAP